MVFGVGGVAAVYKMRRLLSRVCAASWNIHAAGMHAGHPALLLDRVRFRGAPGVWWCQVYRGLSER